MTARFPLIWYDDTTYLFILFVFTVEYSLACVGRMCIVLPIYPIVSMCCHLSSESNFNFFCKRVDLPDIYNYRLYFTSTIMRVSFVALTARVLWLLKYGQAGQLTLRARRIVSH